MTEKIKNYPTLSKQYSSMLLNERIVLIDKKNTIFSRKNDEEIIFYYRS